MHIWIYIVRSRDQGYLEVAFLLQIHNLKIYFTYTWQEQRVSYKALQALFPKYTGIF